MRQYTKLEQLIRTDAANFPPQNPWTELQRALIKLAKGDPVAAQAILAQVPLEFSPKQEIWDARFTAALYSRDYDTADRVIAAMPEKFSDRFGFRWTAALDGLVAVARGDKQIFLDARKRWDTRWGSGTKDALYFAEIAEFDAGLVEKKRR
jgi:hypothetical protein